MKAFLNTMLTIPLLVFSTGCSAQIKNAKSKIVMIDGNCEMCKKTIESAVNTKKIVDLDWNKDTKTAKVEYDSVKTNIDEILKKVAKAGYDNEIFLVPDDVYASLPSCCKYKRNRKRAHHNITALSESTVQVDTTRNDKATNISPFVSVFDVYFELKNELIKANSSTVAVKAKELATALLKIDMIKLENNQHEIWMKTYKQLINDSEHISLLKDIEEQRKLFMSLSNNMYELAKVAKLNNVVFYQHCPMYNDGKGANWLSKESGVKNPYYGSQMLNCGKTIETIK